MGQPARTWFITGGTPGGFGMAYAEAALERGDDVVLTVRRPQALEEWAARYGSRVLVTRVDVTDPRQVHAAVRAAQEAFGRIDVLVNNAGRGWVGSVEGMTDAAARASMEVNFFSAVEVLRAALPDMRRNGSGWVVNMSSAAGLRGQLGFGHYSAAKFAIEGLTEVLREEVAPFGIKVMLVEPGAFRTRAYASFEHEPVEESTDAYASVLESVRDSMIEASGRQPGDPDRAVRAVIEAMEREEPPTRLVLGAGAHAAVTSHLREKLRELEAGRSAAIGADFPS